MQDTEQPPLAKSKFDVFVQKTAYVLMAEPENLQSNIDRLRDLYRPANVQEEFWLTQIAVCQMRMERLDRLESGLFSHFIEDARDIGGLNSATAFPPEMREHEELDARQRLDYMLAEGFKKRAANPNMLLLFNKFRVQTERQLRRAQEQFDIIRKQRLVPPPPPPASPVPDSAPQEASRKLNTASNVAAKVGQASACQLACERIFQSFQGSGRFADPASPAVAATSIISPHGMVRMHIRDSFLPAPFS